MLIGSLCSVINWGSRGKLNILLSKLSQDRRVNCTFGRTPCAVAGRCLTEESSQKALGFTYSQVWRVATSDSLWTVGISNQFPTSMPSLDPAWWNLWSDYKRMLGPPLWTFLQATSRWKWQPSSRWSGENNICNCAGTRHWGSVLQLGIFCSWQPFNLFGWCDHLLSRLPVSPRSTGGHIPMSIWPWTDTLHGPYTNASLHGLREVGRHVRDGWVRHTAYARCCSVGRWMKWPKLPFFKVGALGLEMVSNHQVWGWSKRHYIPNTYI